MKTAQIRVGDLSVRYRDRGGAGPVVLLIHGIGGSLDLWAAQFTPANDGMRLIALDLPGHGLSDFGEQPYTMATFAQFVWRFADTLSLGAVHLAGNSMGGAISLRMLAQQPARVESVLLAAGATLGRESPTAFRLMTLPLLGRLMTRAGPMAIQQQIQAIFAPGFAVPPALREAITRNVMRPGAQSAFLATLRRMADWGGQRQALVSESHEILRQATAPIFLLHGRLDRVLPVRHSEQVHRELPTTRLQVLETSGHTPQMECAEVFNAALRDWVFGV